MHIWRCRRVYRCTLLFLAAMVSVGSFGCGGDTNQNHSTRTVTPILTQEPTETQTPTETPIPTATLKPTADSRFVDNGDGTITDNLSGLMWEKKVGLAGGGDTSDAHAADNVYAWAGLCSLADTACQPTAEAAAACAEAIHGEQPACSLCPEGQGPCLDPASVSAVTTIWDWIAGLNGSRFAGYSDWRVPTATELETIVDYGVTGPAVDAAFMGESCGVACTDLTSAACSCTEPDSYWSATTFPGSDFPNSAWQVTFIDGSVYGSSFGSPSRTRGVRGAQTTPVPRFVDNGDGTITDHQSGLMWEKKVALGGGDDTSDPHAADKVYAWAGLCSLANIACQPTVDAAAACAEAAQGDQPACSLCPEGQGPCLDPFSVTAVTTIWDWLAGLNGSRFAGYSDWRVPTVTEQETIVDYGVTDPAVDAAFTGESCGVACTDLTSAACSCTEPDSYWSATTFPGSDFPNSAWGIDFDLGFVGFENETATYHTRAVRTTR